MGLPLGVRGLGLGVTENSIGNVNKGLYKHDVGYINVTSGFCKINKEGIRRGF